MPKRKKQEEYEEEEEEVNFDSQNIENEDEDGDDIGQHNDKRQKKDDTPDAGIIERIVLENFMCHKHLDVPFGNNINFIVGVNGSGKSAVLIGLAICLGAKAGFTYRASKLSDLIKTGSHTATITVKLRNQGPEAYRHDDFGNSIIVERKIHRDGGTAYKLKDATGKRTISTTATELTFILEQFNMQVNNPCAILMQETSKQFLATAKPQDKYQFFLMATQMDQMKKDFDNVNEHLTEMKAILKKKELMLPELVKQYEELKKEYKDIQQMKNLEEEVNALKRMLAWAFPKEKEELLKKEQDTLESMTSNKVGAEKKMAKLRDDEIKHQKTLEERQQAVEAINRKMITLRQQQQTCSSQINDLKKEQSKRTSAENDLKKRIEQCKKRKETLQKFIQKERDKVFSDSQVVKQKRDHEVQEKASQIRDIQQQIEKISQDRDQANNKLEEAVHELQEIERKMTDISNLKQRATHNISQCEEQKKDRQRVYGPNVPALLSAIQKNKQAFSKVPLGPIGTYVTLKDPYWAKAVEEAIKPDFLRSFIVSCAADDRALKQVCNQSRIPVPPVFIQEYRDRPYQLDARQLPEGKTVYKFIESSQPTVMNALIDQRKVEGQALVETRQDAQAMMFTGQVPRGVLEAYTRDGSHAFLAKRGKGQNFTGAKGPATILGANPEERIRQLKEEVARHESQLRERQQDRDQRDRARQDLYNKKNAMNKEVQSLQRKIPYLENEIKELENVPEEKPADLSEQEAGVQKCDDEVLQLQDQLIKLQKNSHSNVSQQLGPLEEQNSQIQKELDGLDAESESTNRAVEDAVKKLTTARKLVENLVRDISTSGTKIAQAQATVDTLTRELQVETEKAAKFCPRVEVAHTASYLDKQIGALNNRLQQERSGRRNPAEVEKSYKDASSRMRELLLDHLGERHRRWIFFRQAIAKRTRIFFNSYLSNKGYTGTITFDHDNKKLDIQIQLDRLRPSEQQQVVKDTKSLSGGERSFSTVSLLLALWEAMETPVRAMDEFDVFMDAVNRRLSINMLTEAGKEHKNRQFIFISPHDTSHIPQSPFIRVIRMKPPERGQTTINFEGQG